MFQLSNITSFSVPGVFACKNNELVKKGITQFVNKEYDGFKK